MKANFHTHTTWCDGRDTPEKVVLSAIGKGFSAIGFSSHAMLPGALLDWTLTAAKLPRYSDEIRFLEEKYRNQIEIFCGVEADYIHDGSASPDRAVYSAAKPDYIIGSIHFVLAPDSALVPVDKSPESLADGIRLHFDGEPRRFIQAYFAQQREMALKCDFDVIGHPDLCRKFNGRLQYFDETAPWYIDELEKTAEAFAKSGKLTEVNTGAISRGWMDDAYPSREFRRILRERGLRFMLSADAHSADAIDCAFDRFGSGEDYTCPCRNSNRQATGEQIRLA